MSLREQRCIFNCQISDALATPFAVSDVFLAYADTNLADMQSERSEAVLAHFVAHSEPIGYLSFAPGGQILLTSGVRCFTHFFISSFFCKLRNASCFRVSHN
uniref:Uncharacterized protein n=1 Tax=Parascaris equorum TaxID=6256 RepID=A0A914RUS9_PAREQ